MRRNSNTTNDFPDKKGTVVPKSVLMSISTVSNDFLQRDVQQRIKDPMCVTDRFLVGVYCTKKGYSRGSDRNVFQYIAVDVN